MIWLLILPGLVVAYFMFLRPILMGMPAFKEFFAEADGFWPPVSPQPRPVPVSPQPSFWAAFFMAIASLFRGKKS